MARTDCVRYQSSDHACDCSFRSTSGCLSRNSSSFPAEFLGAADGAAATEARQSCCNREADQNGEAIFTARTCVRPGAKKTSGLFCRLVVSAEHSRRLAASARARFRAFRDGEMLGKEGSPDISRQD